MGANCSCHPDHSQQVVETVCLLTQHYRQGVKAAIFIPLKQDFHCLLHVQTL